MDRTPAERAAFPAWIRDPQMLVALSALLLSLCGLGIAIYEASLIRQAQRASVWPHVEVQASLSPQQTAIRVENTGIGPARIRAAALSFDGETLQNWTELLQRLAVRAPGAYDAYLSLINGRVLSANASETIFAMTPDSGPGAEAMMAQLRQAVLDGTVDVEVCYCSVYGECWGSTLQDLVSRSRAGATPPATRSVEGCDAAEVSGI